MTVGELKKLLKHYDDDYEIRLWNNEHAPMTDNPEGVFVEHNFDNQPEKVVVIY